LTNQPVDVEVVAAMQVLGDLAHGHHFRSEFIGEDGVFLPVLFLISALSRAGAHVGFPGGLSMNRLYQAIRALSPGLPKFHPYVAVPKVRAARSGQPGAAQCGAGEPAAARDVEDLADHGEAMGETEVGEAQPAGGPQAREGVRGAEIFDGGAESSRQWSMSESEE
jgi:hypothetical protein